MKYFNINYLKENFKKSKAFIIFMLVLFPILNSVSIFMTSGYNINTEYQAYGPNILPGQYNQIEQNEYEQRISKLERQVKNLDIRLQKLEQENISTEDNFYML